VRILLDTHVWLWMLTAPSRLGDAATILADTRNELLLSAASSWEIAIKFGLGRLPLPEPPARYIPTRIRTTNVTPLAIEHRHTHAVAELPDHHQDPFDRLLVAQAQLLDVPLATSDERVGAYDVRILPVG
jgi:PIN domain nuclease of toxin-antitoxin system